MCCFVVVVVAKPCLCVYLFLHTLHTQQKPHKKSSFSAVCFLCCFWLPLIFCLAHSISKSDHVYCVDEHMPCDCRLYGFWTSVVNAVCIVVSCVSSLSQSSCYGHMSNIYILGIWTYSRMFYAHTHIAPLSMGIHFTCNIHAGYSDSDVEQAELVENVCFASTRL